MKGEHAILLLIAGLVVVGGYKTYKVRQEKKNLLGGGSTTLGEYQDAFDEAQETGDTTFIEDPYLRETIEYDLYEIRKSEDQGAAVPNFDPAQPPKPPVYNGYGEVHASLTAPKKQLSTGDGYRVRVKFNSWLEPFTSGYNWRLRASGFMPDKIIAKGRSNTPTMSNEILTGLEMPRGTNDARIFIALELYLQGQWKEVERDNLVVKRSGGDDSSGGEAAKEPATVIAPTPVGGPYVGQPAFPVVNPPCTDPAGSISTWDELDQRRN